MIKKNKILFIISNLMLIALNSCDPYYFKLNTTKKTFELIHAVKLTDMNDVERISDNSFKILPNAKLALGLNKITQIYSELNVKVSSGEGLRFSFRTVSNDFENNPKISFEYLVNNSIIKENNKIISLKNIKFDYNELKVIRILNNGNKYCVTVDCDTIYNGITNLPATEYLMIESLKETNAIISGIYMTSSNGDIK